MPGWIRGWRMSEGGPRVTLSAAKGPWPRLAEVVAGTALLGACVLATLAPTVLSAQSLSKRVDRRLDAPPMDRNLWGVALVDEKGALLYGRNPRQLFIPASNTKILVAAVSSALVAPDWTVRTSLYADGPIANGVVQGDLVLYGRGDPTFGKRCFATGPTRFAPRASTRSTATSWATAATSSPPRCIRPGRDTTSTGGTRRRS